MVKRVAVIWANSNIMVKHVADTCIWTNSNIDVVKHAENLWLNIGTVFPRNLAAPRIVAAFEISPRSSNAQCTKRRPRILAACGKGVSLLLRAYTILY